MAPILSPAPLATNSASRWSVPISPFGPCCSVEPMGMMMPREVRRYSSTSCQVASASCMLLPHAHAAEGLAAQEVQLEALHALAQRDRGLHVGEQHGRHVIVEDLLRIDIELAAVADIGDEIGLVHRIGERLAAPMAGIAARLDGVAAEADHDLARIGVIPGAAEHHHVAFTL